MIAPIVASFTCGCTIAGEKAPGTVWGAIASVTPALCDVRRDALCYQPRRGW